MDGSRPVKRPLVVFEEIGCHLLDQPILAPRRRVHLGCRRFVVHQVESLTYLILANSDDLDRFINKDAANILGLSGKGLSMDLCLHGCLDLEVLPADIEHLILQPLLLR